MDQAPGDPKGYETAYEEGKRAIAEQAEVLKDTRDRVGTVMSAAAVVAGLGAALAFNNDRASELSSWGGAAAAISVTAFATLTLAAVMIWRPFPGSFTIDPGVLVAGYVEGEEPARLPEIHRALAVHAGRHVNANGIVLERRLRWFTVALSAFLVVVAGLIVVLADVA